MANFVKPYRNDPFIGHLSTPITTSASTRAILENLPAYRPGLSSIFRGLEIGMAHGYFLVGPFTYLGPLRNSEMANFVGLFSAIGLISILAVALTMYGYVTFEKAVKDSELEIKKAWNEFTIGFTIGGFGASGFAFLLVNYLF
jgi:photosystem I subunit 11